MNNFSGLVKIAQQPTVGDVMARINADLSLNSFNRRSLLDQIRDTRLPVSSPASKLLYIGGGAALGSKISKYLGFSPFWRGVATLGLGLYGNRLHNSLSAPNKFGVKTHPLVRHF
jgi:hypothetical protein